MTNLDMVDRLMCGMLISHVAIVCLSVLFQRQVEVRWPRVSMNKLTASLARLVAMTSVVFIIPRYEFVEAR